MKCEICGLRDAAIHIRQLSKESTRELHICEECAHEKGLVSAEDAPELPISALLAGLLDAKDAGHKRGSRESCPRCGLKGEDLRRKGMFGCPDCFSAFDEEIRSILSQMIPRARHMGKFPKDRDANGNPIADRETLRHELRKALEGEEYERAAVIRDRLKERGYGE